MAIKLLSPKYFLGAQLPYVRVLSPKIDEIIRYINGLIDGSGSIGVFGTVTQATSISTAVSVNATKGVITTVSLTTAAQATTSAFVVNNSYVTANSVISLTTSYGGTAAGMPVATISGNPTAGSFSIKITNVGNQALNNVVKVHFTIS